MLYIHDFCYFLSNIFFSFFFLSIEFIYLTNLKAIQGHLHPKLKPMWQCPCVELGSCYIEMSWDLTPENAKQFDYIIHHNSVFTWASYLYSVISWTKEKIISYRR